MSGRSTLDATLGAVDLQRIDAICDQFEAQWRTGQRPDLRSYLSAAPTEVRAVLFRDLLTLELEYLRHVGERPDAESYYEQFPDLTAVIDSALAAGNDGVSVARRGKARDDACGSTVTSPGVREIGVSAPPWVDFRAWRAARAGFARL